MGACRRLSTDEQATPSTALLSCRVDAYLLHAGGDVRSASRCMTERRDYGSAADPSAPPPDGMVRAQGERLIELLAREALPRPYGYLSLLARATIHDLCSP